MSAFPWPLIVLPALGFTAVYLILKLDAWLDRKDRERRDAMLDYLLALSAKRRREVLDNVVIQTTNKKAA